MHARTHSHTHANLHTHTHMHAPTHKLKHTHSYTHTLKHTHTYTHRHTISQRQGNGWLKLYLSVGWHVSGWEGLSFQGPLGFPGEEVVWNGGLEDVQHAGAGVVPHLGGELGTIGDDQVLQAVGARPRQLLIVCGPGGGGGGMGGRQLWTAVRQVSWFRFRQDSTMKEMRKREKT